MFKVEIDDKAVVKKLDGLLKSTDIIEKEVLNKLGSIVKRNARMYVPVDTGALKGSIDMVVDDDTAIIGSPLEYAPCVEYGTSRQSARPYLLPALKDAENAVATVVKGAINKYVK